MGLEAFEGLVTCALEELEDAFPGILDNVAVCVECEPRRAARGVLSLKRNESLLGLYEGIPRADRSFNEGWLLPDKITLFLRPCEEEADDERRSLRDIVREVVWHEAAHLLGLDEERAYEAERRRRSGGNK